MIGIGIAAAVGTISYFAYQNYKKNKEKAAELERKKNEQDYAQSGYTTPDGKWTSIVSGLANIWNKPKTDDVEKVETTRPTTIDNPAANVKPFPGFSGFSGGSNNFEVGSELSDLD